MFVFITKQTFIMKNIYVLGFASAMMLLSCGERKSSAEAETAATEVEEPKADLTITYTNQDPTLDPKFEEEFKSIINEVYPKMMNDFNKDARTDLAIKIDTAYDGVAYAHNGQVVVASQWLHKKPEDTDLMTHEVMHIIQSYPNNAGPGWLTEGIADYVRYKYGVDNEKAGWSLTPFNEKQHYTNAYRITARFLVWISQNYDENLVPKMDKNLRAKTYTDELWKEYTGHTVDELWEEYSKNPELS